MTHNIIPTRVAELSAILKPINEIVKDEPITNEHIWSMANDFICYNQSYYCNGQRILCDYDDTFPCCIIDSVAEFQVLRFYAMDVHMDAYCIDDIPEDNPDDWEQPELISTGREEYKQIWISQNLETYTIDIEDYKFLCDDTFVVKCSGIQPWSFEPRHKELIYSLVNEEEHFNDDRELDYYFSRTHEYLTKNEPIFASLVVSTYNKDVATSLYKTFKIAHRHHWHFPDTEFLVKLYFDYLRMIRSIGRDMLNPKYICPEDIEQAHNAVMSYINKKELDKQLDMARQYQYTFDIFHSYLTGIEFDTDKFHFESLDTPEDYIWEGQTMHHCVGRCKFYQRHELLTMHISDHEGNRVATTSIDVHNRCINELQTICNEKSWREGNEYKEIWNILMARMHTFPKYRPISNNSKLKVA